MADSSHSNHSPSDYNICIVLSPLRHIRDMHGDEALDRVFSQSGLSRAQFDDEKTWLSLEQVVGVLQAVRDIVGSDEGLQTACLHGLAKSYGPLRYVLRALSPQRVYEMAARNMKVISSVSRVEVFEQKSSSGMTLRYFGPPGESRLMCLGRQAQSKSLPTIWGLPPAQIRERSCIARGDPCCEYEIRVFQPRGLLKPFAGGLLGAAGAGLALHFGLSAIPAGTLWFALPALGFVVGHLLELRRTNRVNLDVAEEMNEELRRLLRENAEAQREILDLHQRQQDWNRRLEQQVAERARVNEEVAERIQSMLTERHLVIRGMSHDLYSPLSALESINNDLRTSLGPDDVTRCGIVEDQQLYIRRMRSLLDGLMRLASADPATMQLSPEPIEVAPLEDSYRRRLRALVGDRGIRVSVLATREAPKLIVIDRMVLDRVIDNLLSNAVKYTDRGSIVLELDGKPGFLTVKISDTGRGIADDEIARIFQPGGSDPTRRVAESHGLGLSVVVRLLDRIGGRLEMMTLPKEGSTFWAHFPAEPAVAATPAVPEAAQKDDPTSRVVTIRKVS
ncbi:MAG TPA: HAMP domain-containing sensor histidine kinase [Polyangia bacterium]|nr:HAMP domain-containing sensor histidine kinase [Polyangia bacterium]